MAANRPKIGPNPENFSPVFSRAKIRKIPEKWAGSGREEEKIRKIIPENSENNSGNSENNSTKIPENRKIRKIRKIRKNNILLRGRVVTRFLGKNNTYRENHR